MTFWLGRELLDYEIVDQPRLLQRVPLVQRGVLRLILARVHPVRRQAGRTVARGAPVGDSAGTEHAGAEPGLDDPPFTRPRSALPRDELVDFLMGHPGALGA